MKDVERLERKVAVLQTVNGLTNEESMLEARVKQIGKQRCTIAIERRLLRQKIYRLKRDVKNKESLQGTKPDKQVERDKEVERDKQVIENHVATSREMLESFAKLSGESKATKELLEWAKKRTAWYNKIEEVRMRNLEKVMGVREAEPGGPHKSGVSTYNTQCSRVI